MGRDVKNKLDHILDFHLGRIIYGMVILFLGIVMPYTIKLFMIYVIAGSVEPISYYTDVIFNLEMPLTLGGIVAGIIDNLIFVMLNIIPYAVMATLVLLDKSILVSTGQIIQRAGHRLIYRYFIHDDKNAFAEAIISFPYVVASHLLAIMPAVLSVIYVNFYFHLAGMVWYIDKYSHHSSTTPLVYAVFPLYGSWVGLLVYIFTFGLLLISRMWLGKAAES